MKDARANLLAAWEESHVAFLMGVKRCCSYDPKNGS
jgi:hypothetical protein